MKDTLEQRTVLHYVELHACDSCNLNCVACSHFAPLFQGGCFPSLQEITDAFEQLARLFDKVETIRILGGEPLLNPEIPSLISSVRRIMPESNISVVTNGILLEKWGRNLVDVMVENRIKLYITLYNIKTAERIQKTAMLFSEAGVDVQISPLADRFRLFLTRQEQENSFDLCRIRNCTFMRNGRLYHCALSALIGQFNRCFGQDFPEDQGIELADAESGAEILHYLSRKCALCSFCNDQDRLIDWNLAGDAQPDDWFYPRKK